ncbi:hypothetical protein KR222_008165, partial [Zaprionus bogoriensis]
MFLNDIGQPLIIDSKKTYGPYEQHNGPLLLTSVPFPQDVTLNNWCGRIVGSQKDVTSFQNNAPGHTKYSYIVLEPNEPTQIDCFKTKTILTLIPAGEGAHVYLLKSLCPELCFNSYLYPCSDLLADGCTSALVAENLTGYLDFLPKAGSAFHCALRDGVDVMYVDDLCYMSHEMQEQSEHIYALVQLVRPKYLYGLREDKLPKSLLDL